MYGFTSDPLDVCCEEWIQSYLCPHGSPAASKPWIKQFIFSPLAEKPPWPSSTCPEPSVEGPSQHVLDLLDPPTGGWVDVWAEGWTLALSCPPSPGYTRLFILSYERKAFTVPGPTRQTPSSSISRAAQQTLTLREPAQMFLSLQTQGPLLCPSNKSSSFLPLTLLPWVPSPLDRPLDGSFSFKPQLRHFPGESSLAFSFHCSAFFSSRCFSASKTALHVCFMLCTLEEKIYERRDFVCLILWWILSIKKSVVREAP